MTNWKHKYIEQNKKEAHIYLFKSLEIKDYIIQFFKKNGMLVHKYEVNFLNSNLNLFISYYKTKNTLRLIKKINQKQKIKLKSDVNLQFKIKCKKRYKKRKQKLKKLFRSKIYSITNYKLPQTYQILKFFYYLLLKSKQIKFRFRQNKKLFWILLNRQLKNIRKKRMEFLDFYKKCFYFFSFKTHKSISTNSFIKKFTKSLALYTKSCFTIKLTLHQLNTNLNFPYIQSRRLKRLLGRLRRFKRTGFFKEGINILFNCFKQKNSAILIANFIADQLKYMKRHNFFFKFLNSAFKLLIKRVFSKIQGIKVLIKGRLNNSSRSKKRIIALGKGIPATTVNVNVNSSHAIAYHSNGTLGITVWVYDKETTRK